MIVKTLEEMESIVSNNKNLFWDGWTVVSRHQSNKAKSSKDGIYLNNKWYISKRFEPNRDGWDIPERLIHQYA
jgi:hypothetical protein